MNYAESSLAELAINIPMASQVFRRNRLDFCCGGKITLKEACTKNGLDFETIVSELSALKVAPTLESSLPLPELCDHVVSRYHEDLRRRLPELVALAGKVERVHADHAQCPRGLTRLLETVQAELFLHMMKEENVLFPLIRAGKGNLAQMPVKVMMAEHDAHGEQLDEIHRITNDFRAPADACPTWLALYRNLEQFEAELMEHIHLENHVLFPGSLMQEGA